MVSLLYSMTEEPQWLSSSLKKADDVLILEVEFIDWPSKNPLSGDEPFEMGVDWNMQGVAHAARKEADLAGVHSIDKLSVATTNQFFTIRQSLSPSQVVVMSR